MTLIQSTPDTARLGWAPSLVATNLTHDESLRGRLSYDGYNPEGEMKSIMLAQYVLEETTIEAAGSVQRPTAEVRVSFEKVLKMQVQMLPNQLMTAYPMYFREIGASLAREISLWDTSMALTAFTADTKILTTKYTTTAIANIVNKTAVQDGVLIITANNSADPTAVKTTDYGISAKKLMQATTLAKSRDGRYRNGVGMTPMGMSGGTPVYGFGRPYVLCTEFDQAELMMWQYGIENDPTITGQYANIVPGLTTRAFAAPRSPNDTGRYDLDGNARTAMRESSYYNGFEIIPLPPTKDGSFGAETLLYGAPGVQKINLTGTGAGKTDIIYRIVIAHSDHVARWKNFRTQPILAGTPQGGNRSVELYDAAMTIGAHRNDGKGIVMLEVRRPYNYDGVTGMLYSDITGSSGLPPQNYKFGGENTSMAGAMAKGATRSALSVKVDDRQCKAKISINGKDPQVIDLNEIPNLQELPNANGTGTVITGGHLKSMSH